ncbi:MCE family protein [Nocardioides zeae]|uniref:MCE family protein n=1 Tax=Nocardioides zeae TaxID=1457234 RepID=A0A6P0HGV0_9ACTN|nr:MCE family protein [Nocardioides zeae]NEN77873.1 MCE family protein [Nocardioides zeae]
MALSLPRSSTVVRLGLVAALLLVAFTVLRASTSTPYTLTFVMPSANQAFEGGRVLLDGETVGSVEEVGVRDGQAVVTVAVDPDHAPLPSGTSARITWESVLGARVLELLPGAAGNAAMPSGHLVTENVEAVELDDLLALLDEPTRRSLQGLVVQLDNALSGSEADLNETIRAAGPTIEALGEVLRAVGEDGPAIRALVTELSGVAQTVASRDDELSASVTHLRTALGELAGQQQALSATLERLPGTLATAEQTLDGAVAPIGAARELLQDLRPLTDPLPEIAATLRPVLANARPVLEDLTPTLADADELLTATPALVNGLNDALPTASSALDQLNPMVAFLRPYTPELAGWLSNWVGIFGSQNTTGNYARALITASTTSVVGNPGIPLPGTYQDARPAPGSIAGQSWTDANGDDIS